MKRTASLLIVLCLALLAGVISFANSHNPWQKTDSKYRVFCANGKLEVEQRTMEQEKNARGSNVCQLAEFDYASDADKYAEHHGGKGSDCKCD